MKISLLLFRIISEKLFNKSLFLSLCSREKTLMFVLYLIRYAIRKQPVKKKGYNYEPKFFARVSRFMLTLLTLFVFVSNIMGQGWEKVFEPSNTQESQAQTVIRTLNSNYVAAGYARPYFPNLRNAYVVRVDQDGDLVWQNLYGNENFDDRASSLTSLENENGFIVAGYSHYDPNNQDSVDAYVFRIDPFGKLEWEIRFGGNKVEELYDIIPISINSFVVVGKSSSFGDGSDDVFLAMIDDEGNVIWQKTVEDSFGLDNAGASIIQTIDGGFAIIGTAADDPDEDKNKDLYLLKVDAQGNKQWEKYFGGLETDEGSDLTQLNNGDYILCGYTKSEGAGAFDVFILKVDENGELIWQQTQGNQWADRAFSLKPTSETTFAITGFTEISQQFNRSFYLELDTAGTVLKNYLVGFDYEFSEGYELIVEEDGSFLIAGVTIPFTTTLEPQFYLVKSDALGNVYSNYINGRVARDENSSCTVNSGEARLGEWIVIVTNNATGENHASLTDQGGKYSILVDTGSYSVSAYSPNDLWELCDNDIQIAFDTFYGQVQVDFPAQPLVDCPQLEVHIDAPGIRKCGNVTYNIRYKNSGTATATDASIEVVLDDDLAPLSSTPIPWSQINGDTVVFELGNIEIQEEGVIDLLVEHICDGTITGQAHCVSAHIFPDTLCIPPNSNFSDSSVITVRGTCDTESGEINFEVENIGDATLNVSNMSFIIVEDHVIFMEIPKPDGDTLSPSQVLDTSFISFGNTYRIIADQAPAYPYNCSPTVAIEGCRPDTVENFNVGYVNDYGEADCVPYISKICLENKSALESNVKVADPEGVDSIHHYITPTTDLEYKIIYQNVGTDTAFQVVIRDTLPIPELDLTTFKLATYSHEPKTVQLSGNGNLKIVVDSLYLPPVDSSANEEDSYGYVSFRLSQRPDTNAVGTIIPNRAAIYFDFNTAIITDTVFHTVGGPKTQDFIKTVIVEHYYPNSDFNVVVYPNPLTQTAIFEISSESHPKTVFTQNRLIITDVAGKPVQQHLFDGTEFQFRRRGLAPGIYFYQLFVDKENLVNFGKIIVQ